MANIEIIIILLSFIAILSVVADKIKISNPILLVLLGLSLGFAPGLPMIVLNPDLVFLIFLPPLLYAAAWTTSWHDFKAAKRPISLLAIGLVLFTTSSVAVAAHYLIPGFSWPFAFILGAIVSPPDAVAATSVTKGLGVPKRIITILEGESLVNDASGLIAYKYAVAAAVTGTFVLWEASLQFVLVSAVGILIGLVIGWILYKVHKLIKNNPTVDTSLTLLSPYIAYLTAEHVHSSGVLAVVTCGLFLSWREPEMFSHDTRIQSRGVWNTVVFMLNGVVFILIGLQLPFILQGLSGFKFEQIIEYGILISFVVMVIRIIWVFPAAYIPRMLYKSIRIKETDTNWQGVLVIGWAGMRGVVSLAAALALPVTIKNGVAFPERDLILFIAFCVILSTLVFQGLSLPILLKWLNVKAGNQEEEENKHARITIATAAIVHIEENIAAFVDDNVLNQLKHKYELRIDHLNKRLPKGSNAETEANYGLFEEFTKHQKDLLKVERNMVIEMHKKGSVSEEVLRKIQAELDFEESIINMEEETL